MTVPAWLKGSQPRSQQESRPHAKTRWERLARLMGATLLCSSLLAVPERQAQGQSTSATITEILDSNQVYVQNRTAQVNAVVQQRQQVRTQAARASLQFNTGAVARLAHNSSLVVGQCAQLNRGTLLVNGTLNGCSTSTIAGVRGTIYTIEVTEAGQTVIQVFEGEVVVQRNPAPMPEEEDFNPTDPSLDSTIPSVDPVIPSVNTGEAGPVEPPPVEPPPVEPPPVEPPPIEPPPVEPPPVEPPPVEPTPVEPTGPTEPAVPFTGPLGFLAAPKQNSPNANNVADPTTSAPTQPDTVEFTPDDSITLGEGQQATVDAENNEAVIAFLTADDFIDLLEGPLIDGFAVEIPGINNLRSAFEQLFPGVPLPSYWLPPLPSPSIPFPFPF
jgi:hypothetical protein